MPGESVDLATLSLRVENSQAKQALAEFRASADQAAAAGDRVAASARTSGPDVGAAWTRGLSQARVAMQQAGYTAQQTETMMSRIRTNIGAYEKAFPGFGPGTGGISVIGPEVKANLQEDALALDAVANAAAKAGPAVQGTAGFFDLLAGKGHGGALGVSYLRRELISVAAQMSGTNPILSRMGFTLAALGGQAKAAAIGITVIAGAASPSRPASRFTTN